MGFEQRLPLVESGATRDVDETMQRPERASCGKGLIDRSRIERMRPGAIFVNVGRGGVVDEEALADALRSGHLRGAALDVFTQEPLPPESPLWELENVILSPHTMALSRHENERIIELFADNLRRYLRGDELRSRIQTSLFY